MFSQRKRLVKCRALYPSARDVKVAVLDQIISWAPTLAEASGWSSSGAALLQGCLVSIQLDLEALQALHPPFPGTASVGPTSTQASSSTARLEPTGIGAIPLQSAAAPPGQQAHAADPASGPPTEPATAPGLSGWAALDTAQQPRQKGSPPAPYYEQQEPCHEPAQPGANKRDALALHAGEWSNQRPGYAHVMSSQQSFAQQQGYSCHLALKRVFPPLQVHNNNEQQGVQGSQLAKGNAATVLNSRQRFVQLQALADASEEK
ncbi:MAG: hypothetical protein FRX49_11069 [Trebouxia sp. A1-2]|nr:MAG: hypothetical protein FRX49_11069 [Trebouxia sp. A1-2]